MIWVLYFSVEVASRQPRPSGPDEGEAEHGGVGVPDLLQHGLIRLRSAQRRSDLS